MMAQDREGVIHFVEPELDCNIVFLNGTTEKIICTHFFQNADWYCFNMPGSIDYRTINRNTVRDFHVEPIW